MLVRSSFVYIEKTLLWIVVDTFVIMFLFRWITGEVNEGWLKPAAIAALVWFAMFPVFFGDSGQADDVVVFAVTFVGIGILVFLSTWLILNVKPGQAVVVSLLFVVYKIVFTLALAAVANVVVQMIEERISTFLENSR